MIDPHAIINPSAQLADDVTVGPYTIIGPDVQIGAGSWVGPHAVIKCHTTIGRNSRIYQFASIGEDPQDLKYEGGPTRLEIGDGNVFREYTTINRGTEHGGGTTHIGNNNLFMSYTHVAHDCVIGNDIVFSNNATLAGHVIIEDHAILSAFSAVLQFCTIGMYSFICGQTSIVKNVPPFIMVSGFHGSPCGLNTVGLKRHGFSDDIIRRLRDAYKILYRQGLTTKDALERLRSMVSECAEIQMLVDAVENAPHGIVR